jgi:hypothetical protein
MNMKTFNIIPDVCCIGAIVPLLATGWCAGLLASTIMHGYRETVLLQITLTLFCATTSVWMLRG